MASLWSLYPVFWGSWEQKRIREILGLLQARAELRRSRGYHTVEGPNLCGLPSSLSAVGLCQRLVHMPQWPGLWPLLDSGQAMPRAVVVAWAVKRNK